MLVSSSIFPAVRRSRLNASRDDVADQHVAVRRVAAIKRAAALKLWVGEVIPLVRLETTKADPVGAGAALPIQPDGSGRNECRVNLA